VSKTVQILLVAFVTALVLGFAIAFITSLTGETNLFEAVVVGGLGGGGAAYVFGNLSGNRRVNTVSGADKRAALSDPPPPGKAVVFVYRQGFVGKLLGMNIELDGSPVAQIKSPRFIRLVVAPGVHTVTAYFGGFAGPQSTPGAVAVDAAPGGMLALRITPKMGLVQGGLSLELQSDLAAVKRTLSRMPMTQTDAAPTSLAP
jgi:hypothetical protein